jgi:F-type H+-transporting ATPase subunit gamma
MTFSEIGRKPPVFCEAQFLAQEILDSGFEFNMGEMFYNKFRYRSVISNTLCIIFGTSINY